MNGNPSLQFVKQAEDLRDGGDAKGALRILDAGLGRNPGLLSARYIRAKCQADLRRFADSLTELDEILRLSPDHLKARKLKAEIYLLLNQHRAALMELTELVDRYPQDQEAVRALEKLENFLYGEVAGVQLVSRGSSDRRLTGFQEARTLNIPQQEAPIEQREDFDEPAIATRTIAELYLRQGLRAKAIKVLKKMLSENAEDSWAKGALNELEQESRLPTSSNSATNALTVKARKIRALERLLGRLQERWDSTHVL